MKALEIPLPEWIAAAKARAGAAIPGPWEIDPEDPTGVWGNAGRNFVGSLEWADDAEFIAHARLDVPALCEALGRVLALVNETERRLDTAKGLAVALTADAEDIPETAMTATIRTLIERFRRAVEGARP